MNNRIGLRNSISFRYVSIISLLLVIFLFLMWTVFYMFSKNTLLNYQGRYVNPVLNEMNLLLESWLNERVNVIKKLTMDNVVIRSFENSVMKDELSNLDAHLNITHSLYPNLQYIAVISNKTDKNKPYSESRDINLSLLSSSIPISVNMEDIGKLR